MSWMQPLGPQRTHRASTGEKLLGRAEIFASFFYEEVDERWICGFIQGKYPVSR